MGFPASALKAITVHVLGFWALAYLYRDFSDEGLVPTVLGMGLSDGNITIADIVPKGILYLEVGVLSWLVKLTIAAAYAMYLITLAYRWIFSPTDSVHYYKTRDMGHQIPPGKDKRETSNYIQQLRKVGDIPPPYPNGWYEVMRSRDLPTKAVRAVSMIGENFAVFRGEDGKVSIVDAYCPHLGANLGTGGHVRGNCIECPFHGWQFDGETGQCVSIPYTDKPIPKSAKTKVWPSAECHNLIFVWYDAEGRDPLFPLEEIEEVKGGRWRFRGRSVHYIATHIEEISENGADMVHLGVVHGANVATGASRGYDEGFFSRLLTHHWKGNWEPLDDTSRRHVGCMTINLAHTILGVRVPLLDVSVVTHQIGPALVILKYKTAFGCGTWVQTIVPEGPLYQRMTSYAYTDWWLPAFVASSFLEGMGTQLDRDVNIWVNKTYRLKPLFVKEDKILVDHRRWFSQFYSENSKKFTIRRDNDLTW